MKLRVIDSLGPEDVAMLQALYSRSAESVDVHLEKVARSGSSKFMDNYVVAYNHKSIADCGSTTVFIEDVSLLAAKAIQDNPLYAGQETSTRYIDMSKRAIIDPVGTVESKRILDRWMSFYTDNQDRVAETVRVRHPRHTDEKPEVYDRAVKARVFDIMRGFLPAGITTQLSWHTNLRQAGDNLTRLSMHPAPEMQNIASTIRETLHERYGSSGFNTHTAALSGIATKTTEARNAQENWERKAWAEATYSPPQGSNSMYLDTGGITWDHLKPYQELLDTRPRGCRLPHVMTRLGQITTEFLLDFGSFRDIQRHRNGVVAMPLLTTNYGFEHWYIDQLSTHLQAEAWRLVEEQTYEISKLPTTSVMRQYYIALGFRVPTSIAMGLPALLYMVEMRSSKTVHATLRKRMQHVGVHLTMQFPKLLVHIDNDADDWTVRRGEQTITEKT